MGSQDAWVDVLDITQHRLVAEHALGGLLKEEEKDLTGEIVLKCRSTGGSPLGSLS